MKVVRNIKYKVIVIFIVVFFMFSYINSYNEFKIRSHNLYDKIEIGCHPKNIITEIHYQDTIFSYIAFNYGKKGDIFCWKWYDPKGNIFRESTFILDEDIKTGCAYDPDITESKYVEEFRENLLNCLNKEKEGWKVEFYFNNKLQFIEKFSVIFPKYNVKIESFPENAYVYINNSSIPIGKTPLKTSLYIGKNFIELKKEGYKSINKLVFIEGDSFFDFTLKKLNFSTVSPSSTKNLVPATSSPSISILTAAPKTTCSSRSLNIDHKTNHLLHIEIFAIVIVSLLTIYQITKKKFEKKIEKLRRKLDEDYAEGKISREEYLKRKKELKDQRKIF